MKELIVIVGTVVLGAYIFNMMIGSGEDSLRGISEKAMRRTLDAYGREERVEEFAYGFGRDVHIDDVRAAIRF